jgi:hypothetical protein
MRHDPTFGTPLRMAYADPPYPGKAFYYRGHRDFGGEVDHEQLIARLVEGYPHGWALSTSAEALQDVLAMCPPGVRVAAWFRGERAADSYTPLSSWEPVIVSGGRRYLTPAADRRLDSLIYVSRPRTTDPNRVIGAKPAEFCWWLFQLLGAQPGDEIDDLFPGSGGIARAWSYITAPGQHTLDFATDPSHLEPSRSTRDASDLTRASRDASRGDDASSRTGATRHVAVDVDRDASHVDHCHDASLTPTGASA